MRCLISSVLDFDNSKSPKTVMPDLISAETESSTGIQNLLKSLDSGFRRNDKKGQFSTFYETVIFSLMKIADIGVLSQSIIFF